MPCAKRHLRPRNIDIGESATAEQETVLLPPCGISSDEISGIADSGNHDAAGLRTSYLDRIKPAAAQHVVLLLPAGNIRVEGDDVSACVYRQSLADGEGGGTGARGINAGKRPLHYHKPMLLAICVGIVSDKAALRIDSSDVGLS